MTNMLDRTMLPGNILDRLDTLESQIRDILDNAATPQTAGQIPEEPNWSTISGWVITGTQFRDVYGHIVLDSTVPSITLSAGGVLESADYVADTSGFHIDGGTAEFNDVVIRGTIYATAGEIGGWTIATGHLYSGSGANRAGLRPADYPFYAGSETPGSAPFRVTPAGALTATGATINGTITATAGAIGGWTISATQLTAMDVILSSAGYLSLGSVNNIARLDATDATYRLWIGHATAASAPFSVTKAGTLLASNANITGTIDANAGHIGSLDVDGVLTVGTSSPYIQIDGVNKRIRTSTFTSGLAGFSLEPDGSAEFNNILVRGAIHASVFEKATVSAFAGSWIVTQSAGKLSADYTVGGTMTIESLPGGGWAFATGDIVRIKAEYAAGIGDTWVTVTRTGTENVYTTTYQSGTNSITWPKGTAAVDYGVSGKGGLFATADESNSPRLDVFTHAGAPWATLTSRARLGNLNGWGPFSSERYGWAVGDYSGGKYAYYDPTDGLVISGNLVIGPGMGFTVSGVLLHCPFDGSLPYKSDFQVNTSGHLGQPVTVSGGVIGRPGKFGKAVQISEATTNLFADAAAEYADMTYWLVGGIAGGTCLKTNAYNYIGANQSIGIQAVDAASYKYACQSITVTAVSHTLSVMVRRNDGGVVATGSVGTNGTIFAIWNDGGSIFDSVTAVGGGWYLCVKSGVPTAGIRSFGIGVSGTAYAFYFDAMQLEAKACCTPFANYDMPGHTGSISTTSVRVAASLTYSATTNLNLSAGSISLWAYRANWETQAISFQLFGAGDYGIDTIELFRYGPTNNWFMRTLIGGTYYAAVQNAAWTPTAGWHFFVLTWDGTNLVAYKDMALWGTIACGVLNTPSNLLLSVGNGPYNALNGLIDDLAILDHALTADEVKQLYTSNTPIIVATSPFQLMLTGQGKGRVIGHADGLFGESVSGDAAFGLFTATPAADWGGFTAANIGAGDVILGHNKTGSAAIWWDKSTGKFQFLGNGSSTVQVEIGTDGKLLAGAGGVILDSSAITIKGIKLAIQDEWGDAVGEIGSSGAGLWSNNPTARMRATSASADRSVELYAQRATYAAAGFLGSSGLAGVFARMEASGTYIHVTNNITNFNASIVTLEHAAVVGEGLFVGRVGTTPDDNDIHFDGNLKSMKNATFYDVYGFVPLTTSLTSTSWDGDAYSTTAKTLIDLSAVFGAPAGIKAVLCQVGIRDSGSNGTDCSFWLSPNNTAYKGMAVDCHTVNDRWSRACLVIPCDSNGDVYYQIAASGAGTLDVVIEIWGYWI